MLDDTLWQNWTLVLVYAAITRSKAEVARFPMVGAPFPDIAEHLLPTLLYLQAASVFDDALEAYIEHHGLSMPRQYRQTFRGRIEFLSDKGHLSSPSHSRSIAEKRNDYAHDFTKTASASDLDDALSVINTELEHLGFVGPRPILTVDWERSQSADRAPGALVTFDYIIRVKNGEKMVAELKRTVSRYRAGQAPGEEHAAG